MSLLVGDGFLLRFLLLVLEVKLDIKNVSFARRGIMLYIQNVCLFTSLLLFLEAMVHS